MKIAPFASCFLLSLVSVAGASVNDCVDPFVGTAATGHTFPAAACPFGLVQAGPDTGAEGWDYCSGYRYDDAKIVAFSQTHLNGTGCGDLGDLAIMPFRGEKPAPSAFDHADETATPGYYAVRLRDAAVKVEIAAAEHAAIYRITGEGRVNLAVSPAYGIFGGVKKVSVKTDDDRTGLSGSVHRKRWVERTYGFAVAFDRPADPSQLGGSPGDRSPSERVYPLVFPFDLSAGRPLLVKVALSAEGGAAAARRNLAVEIPAWDFEAVRKDAAVRWESLLSRAEIEGSEEQKKNFYTALYHLFLQPNNIADSGERPFYSTFSCWDTFRAAAPLYTILVPERVPAMVDSLLEQGRRTGYLPIWTLWGRENQCMIGTHSIPIIVDWFLKTDTGREAGRMDWEAAYRQVKDTLTREHPGRRKEDWNILDRYGYYPFDLVREASVSRTLECAYDDWCAGVFAKRLGHAEDAAFFLGRANNWRNVFDPATKFVRGRDSKGAWRTPFNPYALGHSGSSNDYTEGNAFQYTWHVMQDPAGLVAAMGGRDAFLAKLDSLFTAPSTAEGMGSVLDVTGLIGQYVHGNEPSHHVIYFYTLLGRPDRAAERVRDVFDRFYLPKPDGLCGNDDCGQMSAWYVFGAMGFYPFNPCGGTYVLGAPQVPKVTLHLADGKAFTVEARNLSSANKYVARVSLGGVARDFAGAEPSIEHGDVMRGGSLVFEMASRPDVSAAGR